MAVATPDYTVTPQGASYGDPATQAAGIRRNLPGLLVLAVRDNERAVASFGVTPTTVKLMILAISGGFVAMAGVLWGTAWQTVSVDLVPPGASLVQSPIAALPVRRVPVSVAPQMTLAT